MTTGPNFDLIVWFSWYTSAERTQGINIGWNSSFFDSGSTPHEPVLSVIHYSNFIDKKSFL